MKIHIIGGPGSGKTTLAKRFSRDLKCDTQHLDKIAYIDGDFDLPSSRAHRLNMVSQYTKNNNWVAEGVFFSWVGSSFKHSDLIVILDIDKDTRCENILSKLKNRAGLSNAQHTKHRERLLRSNELFDELLETRIRGFLKKFDHKVLNIHNSNITINEILQSVSY